MSDGGTEFTPDPDVVDAFDAAFWARLQYILEQTLARLPEQDVAGRVAHCQRTGTHGITMHADPDDDSLLEFRWGGRELCKVDRLLFETDSFFSDAVPVLIPGDVSKLLED